MQKLICKNKFKKKHCRKLKKKTMTGSKRKGSKEKKTKKESKKSDKSVKKPGILPLLFLNFGCS